MSRVNRRTFLGGVVALGATTWPAKTSLSWSRLLAAAQASTAPTSRIEILVNEPIGTISPTIYGHFAEHLGGVIYDGIWVGEDSKVPNTGGIRNALVEALKRIQAPVIRWPGGCFADSYDWRDGTGPREQRPRRTNFWVDAPEWPDGAPKDGPWRYE